MLKRIVFLCLLLLTACNYPSGTASPIATENITTPSSSTSLAPATTSSYGQCGYVEAYQNLADISAKVDQAVKTVQPDASGRAQAYGENCIHTDGHADFLAKETDFYVTINATNLKDNNELGTWIINVMDALAPFSPGVVPGPQPGFVEFSFKTTDDQKGMRVYICQYKQLPTGLSGAEVIKALSSNP